MPESVAFPVCFDDVYLWVVEAIQEGPCKALTSEDLGPGLEREVAGHHEVPEFIGSGYHLEEQFGSGLGKGNVPRLVEHREVVEKSSGFPEHPLSHEALGVPQPWTAPLTGAVFNRLV